MKKNSCSISENLMQPSRCVHIFTFKCYKTHESEKKKVKLKEDILAQKRDVRRSLGD